MIRNAGISVEESVMRGEQKCVGGCVQAMEGLIGGSGEKIKFQAYI